MEEFSGPQLANGDIAYPKDGEEVLGVVEMKGHTDIDNVAKVAIITNPQITGTYFPSLDKSGVEKMEQLFKSFVPSTFSVSLHSLIASTPKKEAPAGAQLNNGSGGFRGGGRR